MIDLKSLDIFTNGNLDGVKLTKIFNENDKETLFLPNGKYALSSPIKITNEVSFVLGNNAVIKPLSLMDSMIIYDCNYTSSKRRFISGGVFDGDGKARKCIDIVSCGNITLEKMMIMNPITTGITVDSGYEFMCQNLLLINKIDTNVNNNTGIVINTSDSVLNDVVIVNYTVGLKVTQAGNIFNNFHIWSSQAIRLPSTIGVINRGVGNFFDKFYFDTCAVGVDTNSRLNMNHCLFNVARSYRHLFTDQPVFIKNTGRGIVTVDNCYFEYSNNSNETYKCTVVDGNKQYVQFINCDFATPLSLESVPASNRTPKIFKIKVNFTSWPGIASGSYYEKEVVIVHPDFSINHQDTVIFNSIGNYPVGIVPTFYVKNNIIGVRLHNVSNNRVTPTNSSALVTVFKRADGNFIPYDVEY